MACDGTCKLLIFGRETLDHNMNDVTDAGATFRQRLDGVAADIERVLERLLDDAPLAEERDRPSG